MEQPCVLKMKSYVISLKTNNLSLPAAVESNQTTNLDESVRDETCQPPKLEMLFSLSIKLLII